MTPTPSTKAVKTKIKKASPKLPRLSTVTPEPVTSNPFPILLLAQPIRVKIWRILGYSHTKTLRLVCSVIKKDIDEFTGISSAIDSTFEDFSFHCNIAIRKVAIHELIIPTLVQFLKYPLILQELEIRGEISVQNYLYIIKSCPNISKLFIIFNKYVIDHKTEFFPLPENYTSLKLLSKLQSIKLISTTHNLTEMFYVYRTVTSLLRDTLPYVKITSLLVWVTHKPSNILFQELMWTTLTFVCKHAGTLRYLNLGFLDREQNSVVEDTHHANFIENPAPQAATNANETNKTIDKSNSSGPGAGGETTKNTNDKEEQQSSNVSTGRRDTATQLGNINSHHVKDIHSDNATDDAVTVSPEAEGEANVGILKGDEETNDRINEAVQFLNKTEWPKADNLEQLWLTLPMKCMVLIFKMVSSNTRLQVLQLELIGESQLQSNWDLYKEFVTRTDIEKLKNVIFREVIHTNSKGRSLPIDLGIFRKSAALKKLSIHCRRRDHFKKLSRAKNVSSLPYSLSEIDFERILLTPWQITRFLVCFPLMLEMALSYWSIDDCQFSVLMTILKWLVKCGLTYVQKIRLIDTKLRFKNKRNAVRKLQQAVKIYVQYEDLDDTRLIINAAEKQDVKLIAPRVSLHKVQTRQSLQIKNSKARRLKDKNSRLSVSSQKSI